MKLLGISDVNFNMKNKLLIRYLFSSFIRDWKRMGVQWDSTFPIHRLNESL